ELERLDEAEGSYKQAIALQPDFAEAHSNLGITLQELRRLDEAEASCRQAIALKPDYGEAPYNLGLTLHDQGRLDEAAENFMQAIALQPGLAEAHNNLGNTLRKLDRLDEAEASYRQAVALKPDFDLAYGNLCRVLYRLGHKASALKSIERANEIDPESKQHQLILSVIKSHRQGDAAVGDTRDIDSFLGLTSNPLKLHRAVEAGLIAKLYEMGSTPKEKAKGDARFGTRSSEFNLLEGNPSILVFAKNI
ncbi:MAG: tetratricopeptide repeat protein, partial [Pseudomonadales bacterium]